MFILFFLNSKFKNKKYQAHEHIVKEGRKQQAAAKGRVQAPAKGA
jgi:hypothetical protein